MKQEYAQGTFNAFNGSLNPSVAANSNNTLYPLQLFEMQFYSGENNKQHHNYILSQQGIVPYQGVGVKQIQGPLNMHKQAVFY